MSFADAQSVPHLLISGPHGTGKTAAVECLAQRLYGETWEANTTIFSAADLLGKGRSALETDERFSMIYRKDRSLIVNFKQIVKWYASMRPLDADFKLMVFEDAESLTFEAQQALRRTMERYSACRFICHDPAVGDHPRDRVAVPAALLCTDREPLIGPLGDPRRGVGDPADDIS